MISLKSQKRNLLLSSAAAGMIASMMYAPMANAVVPNDSITPDEAVDTEGGVNGVGQFYRSDGFVCTGTLINPRTVLFAAHCVNDRAESDYGTALGAAFAFDVNAIPGLVNWINNGFASNPDLNVFNVSQIFWNSDSTAEPARRGFLEADIALASLDTPAGDIPTWALLFSALPTPDALTTGTGTGYHVNITGYGRSGSGTNGDFQGVDFRRRAAENYIGALTSLSERDQYIFGSPPSGIDQNVYFTDFDDPNRNTFLEFNPNLDNALPREGSTAGGDSGWPLILDAANNAIVDRDVVIGVLSGGSRFFNGQPSSSYGGQSFYQPLYAYYEYIAANNPYRYVSAQSGDGNWEDASHWVTDLDPAYFVFDQSGALVNGFPDEPQQGVNATDGDFGTTCFQFPSATPGSNDCIDHSTNQVFTSSDLNNNAQPGNESARGRLNDDELAILGLTTADLTGSVETSGIAHVETLSGVVANNANDPAAIDVVVPVLPAPTIDNGLAGATGFVPNNVNANAATGTNGRYFDVTLSADGTTTLGSDVTIDRLTINGANTGLNIASGGSLTSLIDVEQVNGMVNIDGQLSSMGDYFMLSGMLSGSGTLKTPFLTNVMGGIAPGGMGDVGTLTIDGSAVLASASGLLIDLGANGINDVLAITGDSSLGGNVFFNASADVRAGNSYTFLTTAGSQTGQFDGQQISAILKPVLSYSANAVTATIEAGSYAGVFSGGSDVQRAYGKLLDNGRGSAALAAAFAALDLSTEDRIGAILNSWTPAMETTNRSLAKTTTEGISRFHKDRMADMGSNKWGGTVTVMGSPIQMASNADYMSQMSDMNHLMAANGGEAKTTSSLPSDYSAYLSGSFVDGEGQAMPTGTPLADEDFDGWSITGGLERYVSEKVSVGGSLTYSSLEANGSFGQVAESDYIAGTVYGQYRTSDAFVYDAQLSVGSFGSKTSRIVAGFPGAVTLKSDDDSLAFMGDFQISKQYDLSSVTLSPHAGLRKTVIDFDDVEETGGVPALLIQRNKYESAQGRFGLDLSTKPASQFQLRLSGDIVQEFDKQTDSFNAQFAGVPGAGAAFLLSGTDTTWGEIGAGISFDLGQMSINASADTTVERSDVNAQTYRAGVTYKF